MCVRARVGVRVSASVCGHRRGPPRASLCHPVAVGGCEGGKHRNKSSKHPVSGFLSGLSQNAGGRGGGGERVREGIVGGSGFLLRFQAAVGPYQYKFGVTGLESRFLCRLTCSSQHSLQAQLAATCQVRWALAHACPSGAILRPPALRLEQGQTLPRLVARSRSPTMTSLRCPLRAHLVRRPRARVALATPLTD